MTTHRTTSLALLSFGLAATAAGGCSDEPTTAGGFGNTGNATVGASGSAGSGTGGTPGTAGTFTTSSGGTFGSAGTFGNAGTFGSAGTPATAGGASGGGAGTAGGAVGGSGGGGDSAGDFPASCPAPTGPHAGMAFMSSCVTLTASHCAATAQNMNPPANALDGDAETRWSTGSLIDASKKFEITADLGAVVMISGVTATTANGPNGSADAPPQIEVLTAETAGNFMPVACGNVTGTSIDVGFAAKSARYVKLISHGVAAGNWWAIHEFAVYGTGTCGAGGTHVCTTNVTQ